MGALGGVCIGPRHCLRLGLALEKAQTPLVSRVVKGLTKEVEVYQKTSVASTDCFMGALGGAGVGPGCCLGLRFGFTERGITEPPM